MHGRIGVLITQIGTPRAPTARDLRPYLKQFLSDPRVIDYHPLVWKPILNSVVLRSRPARSARLYEEIWNEDGSPLLLHSLAQVKGLEERLGKKFVIRLGMAYERPTIREAVTELEEAGIERIVVLPLFPQFSTTTTASMFDEVYAAASGRSWNSWRIRKKCIPALRFVGPYFDHEGYIESLAQVVNKKIAELPERPDTFIVSFHGIPKRYAEEGDPYPLHCQHTSEALAKRLGWSTDEWIMTFQSRFGREEWLGPYTEATLRDLPEQNIQRPCVITPGFVSDCLETLHELGIEGRAAFAEGGGNPDSYTLVPCLNSSSPWLDTMADLVQKNSLGWD